ncbi:hypothetical protein EG68_05582 [Paragonimus skrjabini miyazakii]|uniref:Uncharacterized protein n=1 Tax=Paragonimus skrjabini miyazakii TaxID=59628 RepID=A0A8S9YSK4_9TREM|nr:hypothetical protein EG68_05582 [Paragonimus skrjabini miyazakii]
MLGGMTALTGSKLYKVKMHRETGERNRFSSHFLDDLHLMYKYQRMLGQLSDMASSDDTNIRADRDKLKRQAIVRSDFTYEVEEKQKPTVYPVNVDYSPPQLPLENMSLEVTSPTRCPLGSVKNLLIFSGLIASWFVNDSISCD